MSLDSTSSVKAYNLDKISFLGEKKKKVLIRYIFDVFLTDIPKVSSILEIGPGRGEFAEEVTLRGYQYYGIEPSQSLSEELVRKKYRIINKSVPPIDFPDNFFNIVYSFDVIEHFQGYSEAFRFIEESMRVLKEGGVVCIIAPNFSTLGSLFFEYEYQHSFVTTMGRIKRMFSDVGLLVTHQRDFLIKPNKGLFYFIDRLLVFTLLPVVRHPFVTIIFRITKQEKILFKIRKNLYDHILIIGRKTSKDG